MTAPTPAGTSPADGGPALPSQVEAPGPWQEIRDQIAELSQYVWAAGWMLAAEHYVWQWLEDPQTAPRLARGYLGELTRLAAVGGHWVRWDARQGAVVPVRLDRWHRQHAAWLESRPPPAAPGNF